MVGLAFLSSLGSRGSRFPEVLLGQPAVWQWGEGRKEPAPAAGWFSLCRNLPGLATAGMSPWVSPHLAPVEPIHHSQTYLQPSEPRPPQQRREEWAGGVAGPGGATRAAQLGPSLQECPKGRAQADT